MIEQTTKEIKKNHEFYINVAEYLVPLYPKVNEEQLIALKATSYGYFKFLLSLDSIADGGDLDFRSFFVRLSSFEESIKGLAYLFERQDKFWTSFASHKHSYLASYAFEKKISENSILIDQHTFHSLAKGKSAMALSIVDALSSLGDNDKYDVHLKTLINEIHIAFQYLDDLDDFKADYDSGQRTYIISELERILNERKISISLHSPLAYKYLFLTELAQISIKNAINHYQNAIEIATTLNLDSLSQYLLKEQLRCKDRLIEINYLLIKTQAKADKSEKIAGSGNTVPEAIRLSLTYLKSQQDSNGLLSDFLTTAGFGTIWVSAYVGCMLAEKGLGEDITNALSEYFINHEHASFNENIFMDGDSANFLSLYSVLANIPYNQSNWLSFERDGSWRTYTDENGLRKLLHLSQHHNVYGWIKEKNCVSAAAGYALKSMNHLNEAYIRTANHLKGTQQPDGSWKSYWWSSDIYATSYAVRALHSNDFMQKTAGCNWIMSKKETGKHFWANPATGKPSAFYTALALRSLVELKDNYNNEISSGINWLLSVQFEDGSWASDFILRIPDPDVINPEEVKAWKHGSFGTGVIVDDHNSIFTTATVLNLLAAVI
ncbi:prenyltransferase/squalene oxidase repeat-containing protein [Pedobacter psychrotolerans]|uniref:hypothetical protein n=1 Tax=Pedobacter psychrotolerans TaxID=1843235 RepID=UPI003F96C2E3